MHWPMFFVALIWLAAGSLWFIMFHHLSHFDYWISVAFVLAGVVLAVTAVMAP